MIHQHILAAPRPGLSEEAFGLLALPACVEHARKIPQVKQYKIGTRLSIEGQEKEISYSGVAEVGWKVTKLKPNHQDSRISQWRTQR